MDKLNESPAWSIDDIQTVWQLATQLHDGQKYGGQTKGQRVEYLNHIGSVTFEILYAVGQGYIEDPDLAIKCAILHDTIEDTPLSYKAVLEQFGKAVANGVAALSKDESLPNKAAMMQDSLNRIQQQPQSVWAVKMADRICNLQAPPFYWKDSKKRTYIAEAEVILTALGSGNAYFANRLRQKIKDYHRFLD